ncbi:hypothetical protein HMPREF1992_00901 [Selenomonas sp. oral taxon 892 str. F0426]|nr:hypothetical protein HMPREF1992_00901 [Selenomonas sp. oral taxon 892 str. F0426]
MRASFSSIDFHGAATSGLFCFQQNPRKIRYAEFVSFRGMR